MSTNADIVRFSYSAFRHGDIDAAFNAFAPDIEWTSPTGMSDFGLGGTVRGHDDVRTFLARANSTFSEVHVEPHEFVESDDRIAVFGEHRLRGTRGGRSCTVPFAHSWRLDDGKATHFQDLHDVSEVRRILRHDDEPPNSPEGIIQLGLGFWRSKAVLAAVRLGVFTALAGRPLELAELRAGTGVHERGARDFFDSLVALGLLHRDGSVYRNAPAAEEFLDSGKPHQYVGGVLEEAESQWYPAWAHLVEALTDGVPQWVVTGEQENAFDEIYLEPDQLRRFERAMIGGLVPVMRTLPERFPWQQHRTVADIGCCGGALLASVLVRHPHLTATGFDLPALAPLFADTAARHGLEDRMRFTAGSFLTDPLPAADVHVFGHVLHNWDLDTKRMLLRKSFEALPPGGTAVIYETLIDDERRHHVFGLMMSLHMHVLSPGGYDYTGADCQEWLGGAGFRTSRVEHLTGHEFVVIGVK
ncbi:methyltransferase [Saccharopolyspora sp. WRP15-2]|uniref:Methyltransferase n=1 Tax=Saccharopolyspora oryzae TaxID=2997343 RepID=A0ABT4UU39_9PSEU|nr:methyltransferase [Saccharopolyspora oryzae]MDA3625240.1 methyltransferase [Saccharopolyspora oryzae]